MCEETFAEITMEDIEKNVNNILSTRDLTLENYMDMAERRDWPSVRMRFEWVVIGTYARIQGLYPRR